ncbi:uncharacterized protein BJ171DRAFT_490892 [Polychytrium aggregatum]|uniref:uncharacterized protein n=1 Tax=Polychytrium aggregatum TaxID=110093 RepID=UPI0022FF2BDB|nr:uncharacterized protein BJ171DRAFT_490892 [Polychytrium aggregatum]KAI9208287.1 hypothetical protein BJ171DRAFT_490892 [Polychytrium aggregatum]
MSWYKRKAMQQEIFHHLSTAANIKHAMAQLHLAECYLDGVGVGQDHAKASELYRRLADDGIPQAQVAIGRCYENGGCVEQSYETAIEWYSKAAEQGHEDGRLHIIFLRGWFSFIGHGVEQSDVDALSHWHEVSSKSADPVIKPIATHMVGWMYYLGRGTQQDRQRGVKAIRESKSIEFKLGENECLRACWSNIKSGSAASRKLFELCRLGSNRDWLCNHLMIVCQFLGFGTTENRKEAVGIFEQLANEGHSDSQFWVGVCYLCGCGVLTDNEKAFEWLGKSAHQGNPYGQLMVGVSYYNGRGTTQDYIKAAEWFQKSAEQGNQNGWGVESDIDIAVFWFRKSADQGNQNGIRSLRELGRWP